MLQLVNFELRKIWGKRSFIFITCLLLIINVFFMWYANLENDNKPSLSAYKIFQTKISKMSENEKMEYVNNLKKDIDGISFVIEILNMRNSEMGVFFTEQQINENPGVFETYYKIYESGNYLHFTHSFEQEKAFINEMYDEIVKVSNYNSYLENIKNNKSKLDGISIFSNQDENSYSSRSIEKSAKDYNSLNANGITFTPSKTIVSTTENIWTDVLLILITFLFIGNLISEEKEKKLFNITRSTKYGIEHSIIAKILALFVHCIVFSFIFFLINYLFFGISSGWCNLTIKLQSLAPYMESNFSINILEYLIISILTKGMLIFGISTILTAICIALDSIILPYMFGIFFLAISWLLYNLIPAVSSLNIIKYLNIFGILKTENLYGSYLNFNLFNYPIAQTLLAWFIIIIAIIIGTVLCYIFFLRGKSLEIRKSTKNFALKFHPHTSLLRHEFYKTIITNKGIIIILIFSVLICCNELKRTYTPSVQEQYYKNIMLKLEREQTDEKIKLIETEKARYSEAFSKIKEIDQCVDSGKINPITGDMMKIEWYRITAFYPTFERVLEQYNFVNEDNRNYIYDTGYLYLFGIMGNNEVLNDFILLTLGLIFVFSNIMSMENQNKAWNLFSATKKGKKEIIKSKVKTSIILTVAFCILPFICRFISVSKAFPINGLFLSTRDIPIYHNLFFGMPIIGLILLKLFLQVCTGLIISSIIFTFSGWRKSNIQTIFFGILILGIPVLLILLGFDFMKCFSLYPIYLYSFT